ncbi:hypothetical protein K431DRAFT_282721 [Polychaeton citri CBS 116435]|uniref:Uncharacterized protein n=1 Tax=Polychaeton citri CBS 116435 TaxID=1314669 RepID=A0A9P4QC06_9PEZI|nr:hypothetical protein K431DRAFT_282721 [Polychaeton citri CBS 116435]
MAEASSSARPDPEPKTLLEQSDGEDGRERSSSTSKRNSYYDGQRIGRRSRPISGESQWSKSRGGAQYTEPSNFANLGENAAAPPVQSNAEKRRSRPDTGGTQSSKRKSNIDEKRPVDAKRNSQQSSKRDSGMRRRSGGQTRQREEAANLSEVAAPQPVPTSATGKAVSRRQPLEDKERGYNAESSGEAIPPPFAAKKPEDYLHPRRPASGSTPRWLTELYTISYLIFWSIWGTLARLGVQWITFYPGAPVITPVLWANVGGSLVMGFLTEDQRLFGNAWAVGTDKGAASKVKKTIPLYIGLATGFCGSFTSFSSFQRDIFLALSNNLPAPINHPYTGGTPTSSTISDTVTRNGGYSFEALLAVIFSTLALSLGALYVGAHLSLALQPHIPRIPIRLTRNVLDPLTVFLGWGCWLGAVFMAIWPPDRPSGPSSRGSWADESWRGEVIFALVFAPLGCLLRFYASLKLNGLVASFPLGTFGVNMLGTAIEGMCFDIQHVGVGGSGSGIAGGGRVGCQVLQGVMDGFCGCLTTVSTWVAEIDGLKRKHGYIYALGSVIAGLCLMVVIMGSVRWTVGFVSPVCATGYTSKIS